MSRFRCSIPARRAASYARKESSTLCTRPKSFNVSSSSVWKPMDSLGTPRSSNALALSSSRLSGLPLGGHLDGAGSPTADLVQSIGDRAELVDGQQRGCAAPEEHRARRLGRALACFREHRRDHAIDVLALVGHREEVTVVALRGAERQVNVERRAAGGTRERCHFAATFSSLSSIFPSITVPATVASTLDCAPHHSMWPSSCSSGFEISTHAPSTST